jgi:hypothetical protein
MAELRRMGDRPDTASEAFNKGYSLAKPRRRAYKDVLVVISNCPHLYNPCNGWSPTPIRIIQWQPSS